MERVRALAFHHNNIVFGACRNRWQLLSVLIACTFVTPGVAWHRVFFGETVSVERPRLEFSPHGNPFAVSEFSVLFEVTQKTALYLVEIREVQRPVFNHESFRWACRGPDVVARPWPALSKYAMHG